MIYIDPPYNTGKDFVYKDDFKDNIRNYKENASLEGQSNPDTAGRYHTNWLNMIYPRLRLAKNLLRDDGVIFISIDDTEVHNLRKVCDEIFGESNFFADLVVVRSEGGGLAKRVVKGHDNLLVYVKSIDDTTGIFKQKDIRGKIIEKDGREYWIEEDWLRKEFGKYGTCLYEEIEKYKGVEKKKEIDAGIKSGDYQLLERENGHIVGRLRALNEDGSKFYSVLKHLNKNGIYDLERLGLEAFFDFPKPVSLIKELVLGPTIFSKSSNDIVLDFFSGSSTTADAVMQQNAEDGGNRKFIMVQIPEATPENSEARKAKYNTISEISRKRIDLAGEKVKEDYKDKLAERETPLDIGFKAFTLDTTNFREWDTNTTNIEQSLLDALDTFKEGRNEEDALRTVRLLRYGLL